MDPLLLFLVTLQAYLLVSVLQSAVVERFGVSRMQDFFFYLQKTKKKSNLDVSGKSCRSQVRLSEGYLTRKEEQSYVKLIACYITNRDFLDQHVFSHCTVSQHVSICYLVLKHKVL